MFLVVYKSLLEFKKCVIKKIHNKNDEKMSVLLPIVAFFFGWISSPYSFVTFLKKILATSLARFFIPFVIIYNMVYYQVGSFSLMLFSGIAAIISYIFLVSIFKDRLVALCGSYVNIGWLGFPFALLIFGQSVSAAMIALYIGGSIFGNVWAINAVSTEKLPIQQTLRKLLQSPPVIALLLALCLRLVGIQNWHLGGWVSNLYSFAKFGMVFAGMAILGIWLSQTKVNLADLKFSLRVMFYKLIIGMIICSVCYFALPIAYFKAHIAVLFFLFCLPPAANIVAIETHYQGTGHSARYIAAGTIVSMMVMIIFAGLYFI